MNYSGSATITFYVMRVKDENEKYQVVQPGDDPEKEEELELQVSGRANFRQGQLAGPPESCYPDEGEVVITEITLDGKKWNGELTDNEVMLAEEKIDERVREDDRDVPSQDPLDDDYDRQPDYDDYDD